MKELGCSSCKFGLLSAALESVVKVVNSAAAAVQNISESRSALQYACREASKRERMFIIGYRIALVSLKKVLRINIHGKWWKNWQGLAAEQHLTTESQNVVVSLFSIQAFQRRAIKITINKSATLRNHLAFYIFNSPSHDLSSKKTEPWSHWRWEQVSWHAPNVSGFIGQLVEHRTGNREVTGSNPVEVLAPVVQTSDSAIHWINHYPADSVIDFRNTFPRGSDLCGG